MLTREQVLTFLKTNKDQIRKEFQVKRLGLFGSFAEDKAADESDIDLLISFEEDASGLYYKKIALKQFVREHLNRDVDICNEKFIKSYFRNQILKQAIYV